MGDAKISGAGKLAGGVYDSVKMAGSGKVEGDITCTEFKASGSSKVEGNIYCKGSVGASGSFKCTGDVEADVSFKTSGAGRVEGNIKAGEISTSGAFRCGSIKCGRITVPGAFKVDKGLECDEAELKGDINIGELLNGEVITLENSGFNTQIESIGCMKLTVRALHGAKRLFRIPIGHKYVTIGEIEGDDIDIEYVHAKTVRGKCVIIGDGCEIDRLEYTDSINISDKAVVKDIAQI